MNNEDSIKSLQEQVNKLIKQKDELEQKILENQISENKYKTKAKLYDYICERNSNFRNKMLFAFSFLDFIGPDACIYGSFVRKLFDYSLRFDKIRNVTTGSLDNSDINIIYMNSHINDKIKITSDFYNLVHYIECIQLLNLNKIRNSFNVMNKNDSNSIKLTDILFFHGYSLRAKKETQIYDSNGYLIPSFLLEFHKVSDDNLEDSNINDKYDVIRVSLIAWRPNTSPEFSVNNFFLNQTGIYRNNKFCNTSFTNYLSNLTTSETIFNLNLKDLQDLAFPEDDCLPRELKKTFLNKIYRQISKPMIKILENGFDIKGTKPSMIIEKKEDCSLTGCSPPYPSLELECGHYISIMAYKGLIDSVIESTESIRCPYCRKDLKILFIFEKPSFINETNSKRLNFHVSSNENFRKKITENIISRDSYEHI